MHLEVSIDKLLLVVVIIFDVVCCPLADAVAFVDVVVVDVVAFDVGFMILIVVELPFITLVNDAIVGEVDVGCCCCCCCWPVEANLMAVVAAVVEPLMPLLGKFMLLVLETIDGKLMFLMILALGKNEVDRVDEAVDDVDELEASFRIEAVEFTI